MCGVFGPPFPDHDRKHDVPAALARWVEEGEALETIIATRYQDDYPTKVIVAQPPSCLYPAVARFSGKGEHSDAGNFVCAASSARSICISCRPNRQGRMVPTRTLCCFASHMVLYITVWSDA